tara:strand:+ start:229 stop:342 length:114 start_codon:yes stop_codon:yes gene_type:complete
MDTREFFIAFYAGKNTNMYQDEVTPGKVIKSHLELRK